MSTPSFPPNLCHFASMSPNARETLRPPGEILSGPSKGIFLVVLAFTNCL